MTVLSTVAEREGCELVDLPPLSQTIDTDAVDSLFAVPAATPNRSLRFRYFGYIVDLESDGQLIVSVEPAPE